MKEKMKKILVNKKITEEEIEKAKEKIIALQKGERKSKKWFLIIKPYGQKFKEEIKKYLIEKEIEIICEIETDLWREMALPLYQKETQDSVKDSLYRNEAFSQVEGKEATVLFIENISSFDWLYNLKREMRAIFSGPHYRLITPENEKVIGLNAFHIPDEKELEIENDILYNVLKY